jgi:tyrosinase
MKRDRGASVGASSGSANLATPGQHTATQSIQQGPATRPVRRSVTGMDSSSPVLIAYQSAIAKMKALPSSDPRNWTRQARIHFDYCPHGNWLFLPWHRAYLRYFEQICRQLSGMADFALPYWNWSVEPRVPAPFWSGELLDPNRVATPASVASPAAVGPRVLASILAETNFLIFGSGRIAATDNQRTMSTYGRLEGTPHNYIHGFVGGDMGTFMSPLDPIFWLHHNMVERCWVEWNFDRGNANPGDPAWLDREFTEFCDENGNPVRVTVAETLAYPLTYYRYDDVGPDAAGASAASPDSSAIQRAARHGASGQIDVVQRFTAPQPVTSEIGKPATIRIPMDPQALRGGGHPMLVFQGVSIDHTEDFSVHVFLNKPDATHETPPDDPNFADTFAFFHDGAAHGGHGCGNFVVDVSDVMKRLGIEGGMVEAQVVLVPFQGRQPRTHTLTISATELHLVK